MDVREETVRQLVGDALAGDLVDVCWVRDDGRVQARTGAWLLARRREQELGGRLCPWPEGGRALLAMLRAEGWTWTNRGSTWDPGEGRDACVRTVEEERARSRARMQGA